MSHYGVSLLFKWVVQLYIKRYWNNVVWHLGKVPNLFDVF